MTETEGRLGKVIYLAGDSTMQFYEEDKRPQAGWGERLLCRLGAGDEIRVYHREDCPFPQERRYESKTLIVDNCAMAGRSSRSFREEGRLKDILNHIQPGDYLVIQFGHNDAAKDKEERFVSVDDFRNSLAPYIEGALKKHAVPILVSPISLRPCEFTSQGAVGEIAHALPGYAAVMEHIANVYGLTYIDMGQLTKEYCEQHPHKTALMYREDNVHLTGIGADTYADIFTHTIISLGLIDKDSHIW